MHLSKSIQKRSGFWPDNANLLNPMRALKTKNRIACYRTKITGRSILKIAQGFEFDLELPHFFPARAKR